MISYEITDSKLFNSKIDDVQLDSLQFNGNNFTGDVTINEIIDGKVSTRNITGDHGANDYVNDYGFKLIWSHNG